jgi:hypothetical protein
VTPASACTGAGAARVRSEARASHRAAGDHRTRLRAGASNLRRRLAAVALVATCTAGSVAGCGARTGVDAQEGAHDADARGPDAGPSEGGATEAGSPEGGSDDDAANPGDGGADDGAVLDGGLPDGCVDVPWRGTVRVPLAIALLPEALDVAFVIDTSHSMRADLPRAIAAARDVARAFRPMARSVRFAVVGFREMPVPPFSAPTTVGPLTALTPSTGDVASFEAALRGLEACCGGDDPEAALPVLHHVLTGAALGGVYEGAERTWIPEPPPCPEGAFGAVCFRLEALRLAVVMTDAPMHGGPGNFAPYLPALRGTEVPAFDEVVAAARDRQVGITGLLSVRSGPWYAYARPHLEALARETGMVDTAGAPIVVEYDARRDLGEAVAVLARGLDDARRFDLGLSLDDADPDDGFDALAWVQSVTVVAASPADGVTAIDFERRRILGARARSTLVFELLLRIPEPAPPRPWPRRLRVRLALLTLPGIAVPSGLSLGARIVDVPLPGERCDDR